MEKMRSKGNGKGKSEWSGKAGSAWNVEEYDDRAISRESNSKSIGALERQCSDDHLRILANLELNQVNTMKVYEICHPCDEYYSELNTVDTTKGDEIWLTIDSGASENVIGPKMVPQCPIRPSEGSRDGVSYVTANGTIMANR